MLKFYNLTGNFRGSTSTEQPVYLSHINEKKNNFAPKTCNISMFHPYYCINQSHSKLQSSVTGALSKVGEKFVDELFMFNYVSKER